LFNSLRTFIHVVGYRPEEAVGFHPIGINGGPSRTLVQNVRDLARRLRPTTVGNKTMMKILNALKGNKSGASAAEYALIVAVLGGFVVAGATLFGGSLQSALTTTGSVLTSQAAAGGAAAP
jgi:pilus assembly protein Flp/PilA